MARLYYRNAHKKKKAEVPGPGKTVWKGFLLTDDIVHTGFSMTAESLHSVSRKFTRKTLAFSTLAAGLATDTIMRQPEGLKELGLNIFSNVCCLVIGKMIIDWKMDKDNDANKFSDGLIDRLLRVARMPILAVGAFEMTVSGMAFKFPAIENYLKFGVLGDGIACTTVGIACYLISSSNGAYREFEKKSFALFKKIEEKIFGKE